MGRVLHDRHAAASACSDKIRVISRKAVISADEQKTDLVNESVIKLRYKAAVYVVVVDLISCFYKTATYRLARICREIGSTFRICEHGILQAEIDGATAGHEVAYVTSVRADEV